jgi:hypothetical protein
MSCNIWECRSLADCFYILIFVVQTNVPRLGMSCNIWECCYLADCFYILIFVVHIFLTGGVHTMDLGVDMLFSVVLRTLSCYFVWLSECLHAAQSGLWHCIWHVGFFLGVLKLLEFFRVLLAHKDAWGRLLRGVNFLKIMLMFMFIFFELWHSWHSTWCSWCVGQCNWSAKVDYIYYLFIYF